MQRWLVIMLSKTPARFSRLVPRFARASLFARLISQVSMPLEALMLDDIRSAFSFLTILPVGARAGRKPGWSFAWFPLVGLFVGAALVATCAHLAI